MSTSMSISSPSAHDADIIHQTERLTKPGEAVAAGQDAGRRPEGPGTVQGRKRRPANAKDVTKAGFLAKPMARELLGAMFRQSRIETPPPEPAFRVGAITEFKGSYLAFVEGVTKGFGVDLSVAVKQRDNGKLAALFWDAGQKFRGFWPERLGQAGKAELERFAEEQGHGQGNGVAEHAVQDGEVIPRGQDLFDEVNAAHDELAIGLRTTVEKAVALGEALLKAKAKCRHGTWLPMLERCTRIKVRSANSYMKLAEAWAAWSAEHRQQIADLGLVAAIADLSRREREAQAAAKAHWCPEHARGHAPDPAEEPATTPATTEGQTAPEPVLARDPDPEPAAEPAMEPTGGSRAGLRRELRRTYDQYMASHPGLNLKEAAGGAFDLYEQIAEAAARAGGGGP